ncbi:MAG: radical SAM family heme chaperone HemW [candidate division Zixibacteria bacterium]|nr:radical SAM family heme chaperone HemW [candidate division Zixibacteria bacterium]
MQAGVYIHLPICKSRCIYCDFFSQTNAGLENEIVDLILREIDLAALKYPDFNAQTQYLGGGTPSCFSDSNIKKLLQAIRSNFTSSGDDLKEITVEMNPDDVDLDKLNSYREMGINRISLGVQSFDDRALRFLSRRHNSKQNLSAINLLQKAGFTNYSIDLIFAVPGQADSEFFQSLETAIELEPAHISLYCLSSEPGTELSRMLDSGIICALSEENQAVMFREAIIRLKSAGFRQYELSNFALPGHECQHNLIYWNMQEYLGFGPSAHSFYHGSRWGNYPDLNKYFEIVKSSNLPHPPEEKLSAQRWAEELLMLSLRLDEGLNLNEYHRITGHSLLDGKKEIIEDLVKNGLAEIKSGSMCLTIEGLLVADEILVKLL